METRGEHTASMQWQSQLMPFFACLSPLVERLHPPAFIVLRADCSVWLDLVVIRADGPRGVRFKILSFRLQTADGPRSTDFEVCVIFDGVAFALLRCLRLACRDRAEL